jgi:glyoxylase-like metal-dependent hydrolase (beta-lactamase superfamily II)
MRISEGVEMLSLPMLLANGEGVIHPLILWDEVDTILIDAGYPDMHLLRLETDSGISLDSLTGIIITHSDMDHIGGLAGIVQAASPKPLVYAHEREKPYIQGELPPIRLAKMEAVVSSLQGEQKNQMQKYCIALREGYHKFSVPVDKTVSDGEVLPWCGGVTVVYTPGHTPGHICLYLNSSKILVAGDCLNVENGLLLPAPGFTILDRTAYHNSLKKLAEFDIETIVCYHGGLFDRNVKQCIAQLANQE